MPVPHRKIQCARRTISFQDALARSSAGKGAAGTSRAYIHLPQASPVAQGKKAWISRRRFEQCVCQRLISVRTESPGLS